MPASAYKESYDQSPVYGNRRQGTVHVTRIPTTRWNCGGELIPEYRIYKVTVGTRKSNLSPCFSKSSSTFHPPLSTPHPPPLTSQWYPEAFASQSIRRSDISRIHSKHCGDSDGLDEMKAAFVFNTSYWVISLSTLVGSNPSWASTAFIWTGRDGGQKKLNTWIFNPAIRSYFWDEYPYILSLPHEITDFPIFPLHIYLDSRFTITFTRSKIDSVFHYSWCSVQYHLIITYAQSCTIPYAHPYPFLFPTHNPAPSNATPSNTTSLKIRPEIPL